MKRTSEKILNFGVGTFYYLKNKLKNILNEIEKEGEEHFEELESLKKEIIQIIKIPKKLFREFVKSCGFITKEDFEKFKQEIKND